MFLPVNDLPWARRLVAMISAPLALSVWQEPASWGGPHRYAPLAALLACSFLLNVASTGAQIAVRSLLWLSLVAGALSGMNRFSTLAAACALLALGSAGLEEQRGSRFSPIAFRRSLIASIMVGLAQIELLVLLAIRHADHPRRVVFDLAWAALVGLGVAGVYRLRVWGLLIQAVASIGLAVLVGLGFRRITGVVLLPIVDLGIMTWDTTTVGVVWAAMAVLHVAVLALILRRIGRSRGCAWAPVPSWHEP